MAYINTNETSKQLTELTELTEYVRNQGRKKTVDTPLGTYVFKLGLVSPEGNEHIGLEFAVGNVRQYFGSEFDSVISETALRITHTSDGNVLEDYTRFGRGTEDSHGMGLGDIVTRTEKNIPDIPTGEITKDVPQETQDVLGNRYMRLVERALKWKEDPNTTIFKD